MPKSPGRPRVRHNEPSDPVRLSVNVTAAQRDQLLRIAGPGNMARFIRQGIRRELAAMEDGHGA